MEFNVDYYVNEEKRMVVCKLSDCDMGLVCDLCNMELPHGPEFAIPSSYVGKAWCMPGDTFDIELGKKIAFKRAYAKYVIKKQCLLADFTQWQTKEYEKFTAKLNKLANKYEVTLNRREKEIKALIGE